MSITQNVLFNNPADITNLQTEINQLQTTQYVFTGRTELVTSGVDFFSYVVPQTIGNETWTTIHGGLSGNPQRSGWISTAGGDSNNTIKTFRPSLKCKLPFSNPGSYYGNVVLDEQYLYYIYKDRVMVESDFNSDPINQQRLQSWRAWFGGQGLFDNNPVGHYTFLAKYDKYSLANIATTALYQVVSPITGMANRYIASKGPLSLSDDAVFLTTGQGPNDTAAVLKFRKTDLSLVWAWEPPAYLNERPYYSYGNSLNWVVSYKATGARTNNVVVANSNCGFNYTMVLGMNVLAPYVKPSNPYGNALFDFTKMDPSYSQDEGRLWCLNDMGSTVSSTPRWVFHSEPTQLVAGNKFTSDCVIPGKTGTHIWYNIFSTGGTSTEFRVYNGTNDYDTRGFAYTGTDGAMHRGNWLFSSYTGYLVDPIASASPIGTFGNNSVAFFDFLDATNSTKLISGKFFDPSQTYRGYKMLAPEPNFLAHLNNKLFSLTPQQSNIIDYTQPIDVPGTVLLGQPIIKTIYTTAIANNYTLDRYDAYQLNYYGGSFYGGQCYDPKYDCLYAGSANGQQAPLDDMLASRDQPCVGGPLGKCGLVFDNFALLGATLSAYNATLSTGAAPYTGPAFNAFISAWTALRATTIARLNVQLSPRGCRALHTSLVSIDLNTGKLRWANRNVGWDSVDWNNGFVNAGYRWFHDFGYNGDCQQVMLLEGPFGPIFDGTNQLPNFEYQTTNKRILVSSTKDKVSFYDPDAGALVPIIASVPANANHGTDNVQYNYGIQTAGGALPKGPLIIDHWYQNCGHIFFGWQTMASNGVQVVAMPNSSTKALYIATPDNDSPAFNFPLFDPATNSWLSNRNGTHYFEVYNMYSTGTSAVWGGGVGTVPTLQRIINAAPDTPVNGTGNRPGMSMYGNTILTHTNGIKTYDVNTGVSFNLPTDVSYASPPVVCNDILYINNVRGGKSTTLLSAAAPQPNLLGGLTTGNRFVMAMTPMGF